jgi:hypothetical protein
LAALQTESTGFSYSIHVCYFPLPRQFHTAIVENNKETHPNSHLAFSVVPTTFQPFVFPIAWVIFLLKAKTIMQTPADFSYLTIILTVMVFLGGFCSDFNDYRFVYISSHNK